MHGLLYTMAVRIFAELQTLFSLFFVRRCGEYDGVQEAAVFRRRSAR